MFLTVFNSQFTQVIAEAVKDLFAPDTEPLIIHGPHLPTEVVPEVVHEEVVPEVVSEVVHDEVVPEVRHEEVVPEVLRDKEMKPSYEILNNFDNLTEQQ